MAAGQVWATTANNLPRIPTFARIVTRTCTVNPPCGCSACRHSITSAWLTERAVRIESFDRNIRHLWSRQVACQSTQAIDRARDLSNAISLRRGRIGTRSVRVFADALFDRAAGLPHARERGQYGARPVRSGLTVESIGVDRSFEGMESAFQGPKGSSESRAGLAAAALPIVVGSRTSKRGNLFFEAPNRPAADLCGT